MTEFPDTERAQSLVCPRCRRLWPASRTFCPEDGARLADHLEPDAVDASASTLEARLIDRRYEIGSLIGHGTMARVYSAVDLQTGRCVAVKILHHKYATMDRERRRFLREAKAALAIDHPSVVKVLDVGKCPDGRPFLVIEQLEGESLGECLRRRKSLPVGRVLEVAWRAALGLCAVHDAGIVHRDVKPDNIFLVGERDAPTGVRLFDFGLAKLHQEGSMQSGDILGTAAYMPPEQVVGEEVDARSDVYALGVVMFRALTGHLPFEDPNDLELVAQQLLLPPPPPSWFLEGLDPRIDQVVVRAMRKRPENRYGGMRPLAADLQTLVSGAHAAVTPPDLSVEPDVYDPVTESGAQAYALLVRTLGVGERA